MPLLRPLRPSLPLLAAWLACAGPARADGSVDLVNAAGQQVQVAPKEGQLFSKICAMALLDPAGQEGLQPQPKGFDLTSDYALKPEDVPKDFVARLTLNVPEVVNPTLTYIIRIPGDPLEYAVVHAVNTVKPVPEGTLFPADPKPVPGAAHRLVQRAPNCLVLERVGKEGQAAPLPGAGAGPVRSGLCVIM